MDVDSDRDRVADLLEQTAAGHDHLCPRQVLGVRIGIAGGRTLGLDLPRSDKRLVVFMETDGCAVDGVAAATGCSVGRRTLRIIDYGKVAATFADTGTGQTIRVHPHPAARERAVATLPGAETRWHAQLEAYKTLPDSELLIVDVVDLEVDLESIISRPGLRAVCESCGEEIINQREILRKSRVICRACAGEAYFRLRKRQC